MRKLSGQCLLAASGLLCLAFAAYPKKDNLPRMPWAVLLMNPPTRVTTLNDTWTLQNDNGNYWSVFPSLTKDGRTVGSGHVVGMSHVVGKDGITRPVPKLAIGTYSLNDKKWTDYKQIDFFCGGIAIAPDGSRLAFSQVQDAWTNPRAQMHVVKLRTGEENIFPASGRRCNVTLSWSPDGRRIVYDTMPKTYHEGATKYSPGIEILDLESGKSTKIADGDMPAWSPSGEWIAYRDSTVDYIQDRKVPNAWEIRPGPTRLMMVRPDGAASRVVISLGKSRFLGILFPEYRDFIVAPVWSPDSKALLLTVPWNYTEAGELDIYLVDLATLKMTKKFNDAPAVLGWAEAK